MKESVVIDMNAIGSAGGLEACCATALLFGCTAERQQHFS
jgi:hypothetical protein